jgi:hypothetical protein
VLKPGEVAVISDFTACEEYERAFAASGCQVALLSRINFLPPLRVVRAQKPQLR